MMWGMTHHTPHTRQIAAFVISMQARGLSERTIYEREIFLRRFLRDHTMTPEDIECFLASDMSQSTRATYWSHLKAFSAWLVRIQVFQADPCAGIIPPRRRRSMPRPIPAGSLAAVLAACTSVEQRDMVLLGSLAGLRIHEIAKVHVDDVDLASGVLYVEGKGGKRAMVPLHEKLLRVAERRARVGGYWFPSPCTHGPLKKQWVGTLIRRALRAAGLRETPHALRHWYGTSLLESGADLRTVQELMRHDSIASTQIYTAVSDQRRRVAIGGLHIAA
ncbi:tyrosine-type recombinase/integrase [Micrococcales bacterium 31B]|nr:tyrosine-type recombinase/integrase [Micrococcales bacterium 31B]